MIDRTLLESLARVHNQNFPGIEHSTDIPILRDVVIGVLMQIGYVSELANIYVRLVGQDSPCFTGISERFGRLTVEAFLAPLSRDRTYWLA